MRCSAPLRALSFFPTKKQAEKILSLFFSFLQFIQLFCVLLNAFANQNQNLTVGGSTFIIRYDVQLVEHFLINSYRKTLYSHEITSK